MPILFLDLFVTYTAVEIPDTGKLNGTDPNEVDI
jgi:hypothetical protein